MNSRRRDYPAFTMRLLPYVQVSLRECAQELDAAQHSSDSRFLIYEAHRERGEFDDDPATLIGVDIAEKMKQKPTSDLVVVRIDQSRRVLLGRNASRCDVVIRNARVSSVHAAISYARGGAKLIDMSSSNGTFLNGRCLAPGESGAVVLHPQTTIALAQVELRFLDVDGLRERVAAFRERLAG
jgi:hypothetical protein